MTDEHSILTSATKSNLSDKSSDKRKQAALDIGLAVQVLSRGGSPAIAVITLSELAVLRTDEQVVRIIRCLVDEFCRSAFPNKRKGGLIGLSSMAISLEQERVQRYVHELVPPVLTCFSDEDSSVRYNACEAFYNVAKVARQGILLHFNSAFDGLCQLYADVEQSVKDGAQCLDRLVRDIVTESREFDYASFIPLLTTRIRVLNPFVRELVLGWIVLLDSVPEVDMIAYLPQYLEGLFGILASDHRKVKHDADECLRELLQEIKGSPPARAQRAIADAAPTVARCCRSVERRTEDNYVRLTALGWLLEFVRLQEECDAIFAGEHEIRSPPPEVSSLGPRWVTGGLQLNTNTGPSSLMSPAMVSRFSHSRTGSSGRQDAEQPRRLSFSGYSHQRTISGGSASDQNRGSKDLPLRLGRDTGVTFNVGRSGGLQRLAPVLLEGALHCLDDGEGEIRQQAEQANKAIFDAVQRLCSDAQPVEAVMQAVLDAMKGVVGSHERSEAVLLACFRWARLLLERCPARMLRPPVWDPLFEASVAALRRQEDEVVGMALHLIALLVRTRDDVENAAQEDSAEQAADNDGVPVATRENVPVATPENPQEADTDEADGDFFAGMSQRLFCLMAEDSSMLASRGELVVRELCAGVGAQRFFATAARAMAGERDASFAKRFIRVLNQVLLTSQETRDLRKQLLADAMRSPRPGTDMQASGGTVPTLLLDLLKAWFHCPVSTLVLCLWLHWFELAFEAAVRLARLEFNDDLQGQLREFVDLLDSPVFMRVRLAMLETRRHPALLHTILGLIALLPRERAVEGQPGPGPAEILRKRLHIVETGLLLEKVGLSLGAEPQQEPRPSDRGRERSGQDDSGHMEYLLECFDDVADAHDFRTPVM
mmetsp:Transcript_105180/g.201963  ORF Transcript_105180/g.201963 Transcript_105180/m.201963 type:complete len:884 (-) Transcript_105180:29-2680(-)